MEVRQQPQLEVGLAAFSISRSPNVQLNAKQNLLGLFCGLLLEVTEIGDRLI